MFTKMPATSIRRRLIVTLFVAQSIFGAAQILSFTFLPIVATALMGSERFAGVPATITMLGRALAAYPIGWLMDRIGRRIGLSLGYLAAMVGAALCVGAISADSFLLLCLAAALTGAGRSASEQARFAAAEIAAPDRRAKAISLLVFAGAIGALASPFLTEPADELALWYGLSRTAGPYMMAGLLSFVSGAWLFVLLRPDPRQMDLALALHPTETQKTIAPHHAVRPLRQIFTLPTVQLATIVMVVSQLVMTLLMVITPLHMYHHNHAHTSISLVLTAHTLGMFGLSSLTGWLIERTSRHTVIVVGGLVLAISSVLTPFSPQLVPLAFALFLLGLGWNFCFIASSSLLADALAPGERGRAQGANEMMVALVAAAGSLSSGTAFAYGGMTTVSALGLAMSVLLIGLSIWSMRRQITPLASMQT